MDDARFISNENSEVTVGLSGKLNAGNSLQIEEKLKKIRSDNPGGGLVLDFAELNYISSAGLRVLLNIQKEEQEKIKIVNVSSMIMEVFEDTGFDQIFIINKAMKQIDLEGLELIGQGANGQVYRVDDENIVKVFMPSTPLQRPLTSPA